MNKFIRPIDLAGALQAEAFISACAAIARARKTRNPLWCEWAEVVKQARKCKVLGGLKEFGEVCRTYHEQGFSSDEFARAMKQKCDEYREQDSRPNRSFEWRRT